ncbi:MAG: hypothetical protein QOD41_587 [Cryptosporangiaceae bacterium]|nr:hypothetical protein [Cryptosporangiaceae bacterium]
MSDRRNVGIRRRTTLAAIALVTAAAGLSALAPQVAGASSHREAPLIAGEPQLDNTDLYAFSSPDKPDTVSLIANFQPFQEPNGGPNFYPFAARTAYDINIDNDGDAQPDTIFRFSFKNLLRNKNTFLYNTGVVTSFNDPDLNFRQTYQLEQLVRSGSTYIRRTIVKDGKVAPSRVGEASMPEYGKLAREAVTAIPGSAAGWDGAAFAGQSDDPFFLDLRVFDLLYGADLSEVKQDTLAGFNVNALAIQVPKKVLALRNDDTRNPVVGIWASTERQRIQVVGQNNVRRQGGGLAQVSRLGQPLVNEVVIPVGKKDEFNASRPSQDAKFAKFVTDPEVPKLIEGIYKIKAPATPRADLAEVFLTGVCKACGPVKADLNSQLLNKDVNPKKFVASEELRLNMAVPATAKPNRLGVIGGDLAGYPNGRRLTDDVIDITLQAAEGVLLPGAGADVKGLGDGVDANDGKFIDKFPFLALSNVRAVNQKLAK